MHFDSSYVDRLRCPADEDDPVTFNLDEIARRRPLAAGVGLAVVAEHPNP